MCSFVAAGLVAGIAGNVAEGAATAAAAREEARLRSRAALLRSNELNIAAFETRQAGRVAAGLRRRETANIEGSQRAALAANGVDVTSGSGAALRAQTEVLGDLDALAIKANANRTAASLVREADAERETAGQIRSAGEARANAAAISTGFRVGSGLLDLTSELSGLRLDGTI